MKKTLLTIAFLLASSAFISPLQTRAETPAVKRAVTPQIRITFGHDRRRHRGMRRGKRIEWYNYDRHDGRYVRETYWVHGRRYTRWVRTY